MASMQTISAPQVLGDLPDGRDLLGYAPYARALAQIIDSADLETPFTVGIYGPWGTGKTSFMRSIERSATTTEDHVVWFQPWLFDNKEEVWKALLYTVIQHLDGVRSRNRVASEEQAERLQRLFVGLGRLTVNAALTKIPGNSANLDDLSKAFARTERDATQFINTFRWEFRALKDEILGDGADGPSARLLLFVDDLDRCTPESCIMALEAIKLFLDMPGCVFVLGIDRDLVQRGIEAKYGSNVALSGEQYLEKLVQLPFHLPPVPPWTFRTFLGTVTGGLGFSDSTLDLLSLASDQNPRRAKRLASCLALVRSVAQQLPTEDASTLEDDKVATVLILQVRFPLEFLWLSRGHVLPSDVGDEGSADFDQLVAFLSTGMDKARASGTAREFVQFLRHPAVPLFRDRVELDRYMRLSTVVDVSSPDGEKSSLMDLVDKRMIRAVTNVPSDPESGAATVPSPAPEPGRQTEIATAVRESVAAARADWSTLQGASFTRVFLGLLPLRRIDEAAHAVRSDRRIAWEHLDDLRAGYGPPPPALERDVRALDSMDVQRVWSGLRRGSVFLALTVVLVSILAGTWWSLAGSTPYQTIILVAAVICAPLLLRSAYVGLWSNRNLRPTTSEP